MEDMKWLLKRCGLSDFDIADCGNSRNDLLGTAAYGRTRKWQRKYGSLWWKSRTVKR